MSTIFRVEKNKNFTIMSNTHLRDRRLSYKSKGLLSVILSLPPEWNYTIAGLAVISSDGKDSVRSAINELEKNGYILRFQKRDELGRMTINEYVVYEDPKQNPAYNSQEQCEGVSGEAETDVSFSSPSAEDPLSENPSTDDPTADSILYILNTDISSTNKSNHSIIHTQARKNDERNEGKKNCDANNTLQLSSKWEYYRDLISRNVDIEGQKSLNRDQVDEMVSIMTDVVCSESPTIRVNREEVPQSRVKDRFLHLNDQNIGYVLDAMKDRSGKIGNVRSYLITMLYNSANTMENYYSNLAYNDMRAGLT